MKIRIATLTNSEGLFGESKRVSRGRRTGYEYYRFLGLDGIFSRWTNAKHYLPSLHDASSLIVCVIAICEVFKVVLRESGENEALQAAAMQKGKVVDLTVHIAMNASRLSLQHNLPIADSILLAAVQAYKCIIRMQDSAFRGVEGVNYFLK